MPLGFERINERTQRPNALINFIRPLPHRDPTVVSTAELILSRVAAICYPFMKQHQILVQALEEFPHNNEFVGRNFNAGEVIQLVLKNKRGEWLPERWVMMVMVHELAHCKEMNHSKRFWKWRDGFAVDLRGLWNKDYTGEGMWGRGRSLQGGEVITGSVDDGLVPDQLCGGTYGRRRKRRRGRKEKETLSYAERKQRRILKKFGAGGQALGADEDVKVKLERGVAKKGKPRVAGSARGRELRAAAALARFDQAKKEEIIVKEEETDSETDDEYEEVDDHEAAIDIDGQKIVDDKGHGLVKICEDEDDADGNARREMAEIQEIHVPARKQNRRSKVDACTQSTDQPVFTSTTSKNPPTRNDCIPKSSVQNQTSDTSSSARVIRLDEIHKRRPERDTAESNGERSERDRKSSLDCVVCSLANESGSVTCAVCSNVLNPLLVPNHWRCRSSTCKDSQYLNSGDVGICGVCGRPRPA